MAGCCEHCNEPSVSVKSGEFLGQLSETTEERLCSMELVS
jgi:hypothetical protein